MNILAAALARPILGNSQRGRRDRIAHMPPADIQIRNFIVAYPRIAVILFTNRHNFDYGEISQQSGFARDMLAATLCPEP